MYTSSTTVIGLVAALAAPAAAFFRIPCPGRIVTERADPIVNPGAVAGHVHTISGGNGFGFEMDYAQARSSSCSSCPIKQDLSNYWTPKLYYQYQNGSFEDVPQVGDGNGVSAGMTVYYLQRPGPDNDALKAFPEGFRMLAGDPFKRNATEDFASEAISFVCLDYSTTSPQTPGMPTTNCVDGLRAQVFFPSCWDGVNLDSDDHKSHMAYPTSGALDNGKCPESHPVHMISLFYEVLYRVSDFKDMWYGDSQPFVFAQGDPTGHGFHGDFINGWDVDALQEAVDTCTNLSGLITDCDVFDFFSTEESQACIIPPSIDEQVLGVLEELPGCNSVTSGPGEAAATSCNNPVIGAYQQYFTDVTSSLSYEYIGCGSDSTGTRTLSSASESLDSMDVETCVAYCSGKGYTYAGLEYSSQCYCGNTIADDRAPVTGVLGNCFSSCAGNSSEYCGGSAALSLYKKCDGSSCSNVLYTGPGSSNSTVSNSTVSKEVSAVSSVVSLATSAVSSVVSSASSASSIVSSASSAQASLFSSSSSSSSFSSSSSSSPTVAVCSSAKATTITTVNKVTKTVTLSVSTGTVQSSSATASATATRKHHDRKSWTSHQRSHLQHARHAHAIAEKEASDVAAKLAEA